MLYTLAFVGSLITLCALSYLSLLTIRVFIKDVKNPAKWTKTVILIYVIVSFWLSLAWYSIV